ncbi:MAG: GAF domain-containing protein [Polyangiaceae bacterium]|nr:GAF domain-containing protein [Myxococcales bacterium]MCB9590460.1 GAF domain-containing protein [Polyangiaceae bacterium]MCB9608453.1 GAF domain-containing protein [Polyangiaceae bacterium]
MEPGAGFFGQTRMRLARLTAEGEGGLRRALLQACATSSRAINVERVAAWFFNHDRSQLICGCQFEGSGERESSGAIIDLTKLPNYTAALESHRVILANDARTDPDTSELTQQYLIPHGITSMLDAPIFRFGEVVGVVCHEHVGEARTWTTAERDFAASVADVLAVLLEQASRVEAELTLREQRERLAALERMEALGKLSAGVAHDFNNVLSAIMLGLDDLGRFAGAGEAPEILSELRDVALQGKRISDQLMTFARSGPHAPQVIDLGQALRDMTKPLNALLRGTHRLDVAVHQDDMRVSADPAQLDQVVMNLVVNARDAMPDGGTVSVALDGTTTVVELTVRDTGSGIQPELVERIFEPFFTTKGHGNGLGLSTVHSIVQQNGGDIAVETGSQGTTFTIRLPRVND